MSCEIYHVHKRDPFVVAAQLNQQHPLMVFQENPDLDNTHWLTNTPISSCREYKVGNTPVLCSGDVMGSREGILDYIEVMVEEFDYWKTKVSYVWDPFSAIRALIRSSAFSRYCTIICTTNEISLFCLLEGKMPA